jgi:hypothetical protein
MRSAPHFAASSMYGVSIVRPQPINLGPRAKMIVHAVEFAGTRSAAVNEH